MPLWRRPLQPLTRQVQATEHALVKLPAYFSAAVKESMQLRLQLRAATNDVLRSPLRSHQRFSGQSSAVQGSERRSHPSVLIPLVPANTESRLFSSTAMAANSSAAGAAGGQLPEHMQIQRDNVICGADLNYHVIQKLSATTAAACEFAAATDMV